MITTILYIILALLILTTIYVLVRTIIFEWSSGAVEKIAVLLKTSGSLSHAPFSRIILFFLTWVKEPKLLRLLPPFARFTRKRV